MRTVLRMKRLIFLTMIASSLMLALPIKANDTSQVPCIEVTPDNLTPSEACQNLMEDNLEPVVNEIPEDRYTLSTYSYWRVGPQAAGVQVEVELRVGRHAPGRGSERRHVGQHREEEHLQGAPSPPQLIEDRSHQGVGRYYRPNVPRWTPSTQIG